MGEIQCKEVQSLREFLEEIDHDTESWTHDGFGKPWFRGHSRFEYKLLPSILRSGNEVHEFQLTKKFRLMAPGYGDTPDTGRLDLWLFLMQHHGAPTRLLDWSESPLVACFFATEKAAKGEPIQQDAAVYAIDPIKLNSLSGIREFPVTWVPNAVLQTIKFAFGTENEKVYWADGTRIKYLEYPSAIYPSTIHGRIAAQKACFTLLGSDKRDFESIFANHSLMTDGYLVKYRIPAGRVQAIWRELSDLGVTYSTLFPDLDGLAKDLKSAFGIEG
jgi:hypothetical protein